MKNKKKILDAMRKNCGKANEKEEKILAKWSEDRGYNPVYSFGFSRGYNFLAGKLKKSELERQEAQYRCDYFLKLLFAAAVSPKKERVLEYVHSIDNVMYAVFSDGSIDSSKDGVVWKSVELLKEGY